MNILVTGSTGFVGEPLCEKLVAANYRVRGCVWNEESPVELPAGVEPASIGSIGPDTNWSKALEGIDTVLHLAARVHVMEDKAKDALAEFRHVNVAGTANLARQAAAHGVKRLVFLSSVKVNGEGSTIAYTEEDVPAPQDPYGVSKLEAEQVLHQIAANSGVEVVILRPPLVYGPRVRANFLQLIRVVERGLPLPLSGVNNRRSFIYLGNLIDAIATCATHPRASGNTFLVSDREDVSSADLVRRVAAALGRPANLLRVHPALIRLGGRLLNKSDAVDRLLGSLTVDCTAIHRELGWEPPHTMADGLADTATWYLQKNKQ